MLVLFGSYSESNSVVCNHFIAPCLESTFFSWYTGATIAYFVFEGVYDLHLVNT